MYRNLTIAAVTAIALLGTLAVGLAGTTAADPAAGNREYQAQVYGTAGGGVNVHEGPAVGDQVKGALLDGRKISIACQAAGDSVTGPVTG
jgi:hypothetical protein